MNSLRQWRVLGGSWETLRRVRPSFTYQRLGNDVQVCMDLDSADNRCMWACLVHSASDRYYAKAIWCQILVAIPIGHFIHRGALSFPEWGMEISVSSLKTVQYGQNAIQGTSNSSSGVFSVCSVTRVGALQRVPIDQTPCHRYSSSGRGVARYR